MRLQTSIIVSCVALFAAAFALPARGQDFGDEPDGGKEGTSGDAATTGDEPRAVVPADDPWNLDDWPEPGAVAPVEGMKEPAGAAGGGAGPIAPPVPPSARKGKRVDPDYVILSRLGITAEAWEDYVSLRESRQYTPAHYYNRQIGGLPQLVIGWIMTLGGLVLSGCGGVLVAHAPPAPGGDCEWWEDCWDQEVRRTMYLTDGTMLMILGGGLAIGGIVLVSKGEKLNERWIDQDFDLVGASDAEFERYRRQGPWPPPDSSQGPSLLLTPLALPDGAGAGAIWTF